MNKRGPIIIIEDDVDDQFMIGEVFKELNCKNELRYFGDGVSAFKYLQDCIEKPFIILSRINLPLMSGFELKEKLSADEKLALKCTPFLFFSTSRSRSEIRDAYSKSVQGFFPKPAEYNELRKTIGIILAYWQRALEPFD